MRVTIKGLTASTITFNTLGIVLRGEIEAKNIDIKNDDQLREINSIKNAKLISVETDGELTSSQDTRPIIQSIREKQELKIEEIKPLKQIEQIEQVEPIEDGPTPIQPTTPKKSRGRPKGSQNKKVEEVKRPIVTKVSVKPIKKAESSTVSVNDAQESTVTIMTAGGIIKGKSVRSYTGDVPESEATKASIEALKLLEEEEAEANIEQPPIDESKLDLSERMGNKAVIATGMDHMQTIEMKNSIIPEAEQIKKAVKLIELKDAEVAKKDKERAKNAFIDGIDDVEDPDGDIES